MTISLSDPMTWTSYSWLNALQVWNVSFLIFLLSILPLLAYRWERWLAKAAPTLPTFWNPPWQVLVAIDFILLFAQVATGFLSQHLFYDDSSYAGVAPTSWPVPGIAVALEVRQTGGILFGGDLVFNMWTAANALFYSNLILNGIWYWTLHASGAVMVALLAAALMALAALATVVVGWWVWFVTSIPYIVVTVWHLYKFGHTFAVWVHLRDDHVYPVPVTEPEDSALLSNSGKVAP